MKVRTLHLNPPSYAGFDGGAGSRYQARREICSFWYPTWMAYPAGLVPESHLVDAPADGLSSAELIRLAHGYDLIVMSTSTPTISHDVGLAGTLKKYYPRVRIGLVGPHPMVFPMETMAMSEALDFVTTGEYDYTLAEIADVRRVREGAEFFSFMVKREEVVQS